MHDHSDSPFQLPGPVPAVSVGRLPSGSLPALPTMPTTRLQLELLLKEPAVDLKAFTDVVSKDVGAVLQIYRLVGEEYPEVDGRPIRIEDCVVSLGMMRSFQMICASTASYSRLYLKEWHRCRSIAERAREIALGMDGFSPEEAYLVGLIHRLGVFPGLLGWRLDGDAKAIGLLLASEWRLPHFLILALREEQGPVISPKWRLVLSRAMAQAEAFTKNQGG